MTPAAEARIRAAVDELVVALLDAIEPPTTPAPDRLLSVGEAAEALGIGRTAAYGLISAGQLRSIVIGRRRLVAGSALTDFIRAHAARP